MLNVINIGDLISLKIYAPSETLIDISKRFANIKKSDYYDFEIHYRNFVDFSEIREGTKILPFRNAMYIVNQIDEKVIAYSPKQEYSCENLVIREKNKIDILCRGDHDSKILIRLITELLIRKLLEKKFFPIHASCIMKDDEAILFFGGKNSGKSTALFTHVFLNDAYPISNDITFVGKENGKWLAFGLPYDITFDKDIFYQLESIKINVDTFIKIPKYESSKIRFDVSEFSDTFRTSWICHAPISTINFVNLNKENVFSEVSNISFEDSILELDKYGKDKNFSFGDYLKLNNLYPTFEYENLSKEVHFNKLEGNILKHYLRRK